MENAYYYMKMADISSSLGAVSAIMFIFLIVPVCSYTVVYREFRWIPNFYILLFLIVLVIKITIPTASTYREMAIIEISRSPDFEGKSILLEELKKKYRG